MHAHFIQTLKNLPFKPSFIDSLRISFSLIVLIPSPPFLDWNPEVCFSVVLPDLKSVHSVHSVHAVCTGLPPDVINYIHTWTLYIACIYMLCTCVLMYMQCMYMCVQCNRIECMYITFGFIPWMNPKIHSMYVQYMYQEHKWTDNVCTYLSHVCIWCRCAHTRYIHCMHQW